MVVSAVWTVRARSFHLRSVAAVGALFSVGLAVVGLLVVVSRDATHEAVRPMWGPEGLDQFDGQFAVWGTVGVLGAILAWTFARLGFGPLPMRHSPDPAATRGAMADAEAVSYTHLDVYKRQLWGWCWHHPHNRVRQIRRPAAP